MHAPLTRFIRTLRALIIAAPLAAPLTASAQTPATLQPWPDAYARDARGELVRSSNVGDPRISNLCWRTGYWTPAQAIAACDRDLVPVAQVLPPVEPPPPPPPPPPNFYPPLPITKQTFSADVFFDFDKAIIKPQGKTALDTLVTQIARINLEVVIAIGHTDGIGSTIYNTRLSTRRAEAVKAYLISKGIEPNRIYTEGKGKTMPRADNRSAEGRAQNRRVEIEVVGASR